ncbi:uncharacterized protein LOC143155057 [Ptiloglossa arizonensis]|uniref:uncharacterized protein LOC143155057 n=1 Tax=Ptiloglossa arizonensis TaxID=3350558 RepID=UPI003FA09BA9
MSGMEDIRAVVDSNDFHNIIEEESGRSSSVDYLDSYDDIPKETARSFSVESNEEIREARERETFIEDEKKKEATQPAASPPTTETEAPGGEDGNARREETSSSSSSSARVGATVAGSTDGRQENAPVGEWNSLPVLVERLRAALELSLAQGSRRDDEPPTVPEDSGVDSEEDFRIRTSMERVLGDCKEPELRKDLKFLEDLLLSDIQTALSRLRETLERIDVATLAKNGAASDPTSKLHLLRLVSSLLSRLQVPEQKVTDKVQPVVQFASLSRRRRGTRHTIGVSTEELARARKWLEEERNLPLEETVIKGNEQRKLGNVVTPDRKPEEIRDKCVKDAINQRQLLEDKNKEIRENYRGIQQVEVVDTKPVVESSTVIQSQYRGEEYQPKEKTENGVEENDEKSRVSKLAAALRQRAELASGGRFGNKFTAKKSKIKRANTIDIPSYLKLQAETLGHESTGCVSLRRPINVGDKAALNAATIVPTFQPKTENDRKFLALINKNNEPPTAPPVAPFKPYGYAKTPDMSSLTNKHWNSRFSNIKTTFDKPSATEDRENRPSLKARANKWFSGMPQTQYPTSERNPDAGTNYNAPMMRTEAAGGFRHAPSSPFRKIERPSPVSPSKVPTTYHWPKNAPAPTNTLREKARMMFDREVQPSSKPRPDTEHNEKPTFPRPPWIDHDRGESRGNGAVTENGRLDYRSFCKQFAPFVGKGTIETKKLEEQRPRDLTRRDNVSGVVDGKISFKMLPDKRVQTYQYPPMVRPEVKEKLVPERNAIEAVKSGRGYPEKDSSTRNPFPDATLRGSSSVAVQTGINDEHQDEGRSFRVAPKISKGSGLVCSNASVQTCSDLERPTIAISDTETGKQWRPLSYEGSDPGGPTSLIHRPDPQRIVPDRDQNYRNPSNEFESNWVSSSVSDEQGSGEIVSPRVESSRQREIENPIESDPRPEAESRRTDSENQDCSFVSPSLPVDDFPDDQNIQNQDISPDIGVVTRYTCAIATVASSVDSPEPRSEEVAVDSRTSSSPSPSQFSWSKSKPPTSETPEDEIRRHNLLQQSLVRRLQNEITSLNDESPVQLPVVGQHLTVDQSRTPSHPSIVNQLVSSAQSRQQSVGQSPGYSQPANFVQNHQQGHQQGQVPTIGQHLTVDQFRTPGQLSVVNQTKLSQSHQQSFNFNQPANFAPVHRPGFNQAANFDQPSSLHGPGRFAKFLAPVPQKKPEPPRAHSPGPITANRVGALRDAYELAPNAQSKPINKERSPIPNGVPIDSSDEYLVSCATKPSRSIVLSKSESWHQLAISNSYPRAPRVNVPASTSSRVSSHTKPPKPKSPSSQKLRSKQFEASSMADSVKKMEDKIRQYFDNPAETVETRDHSKHRRSPRALNKGMVGLSRSRTMPGITDEKLRLTIPVPQQMPLLNVNTADVDKVFDDLFEEATRTDGRQC